MVWEFIRGSTSPPKNVCVVMPNGPFDFTIQCNVTQETIRQIIDRDRVCIIEYAERDKMLLSYCGQGKDVAARLFK
jgi:hypothetical protein